MPQRIWRSHCPIEVREMQHKVLDMTVHLLMIRQNGPTAFTILDDNDKLSYQVYLGDPHKCSCKYFQRINELCSHICWVLLKKMQLDPKDPLSFQLGMLPREITDCLQPQFIARPKQRRIDFRKFLNKDERKLPCVKRRAVRSGDTCPVCLEAFEEDDKQQNITYCRHGCGNCIHVRCMELIAKHQLESHNECLQIICPLCRGDFGTMSELRSSKFNSAPIRRNTVEKKVVTHSGYTCCSCDTTPVIGNLYRCLQCTQVTFCHTCVNSDSSTAVYHETHGFAIKTKEGERWKPLPQFWRRGGGDSMMMRRRLPPLVQNGHLKASNDVNGVRTFPPPAVCVPVAVSRWRGRGDCSRGRGEVGNSPLHLLPAGCVDDCTPQTQPETESRSEMGGGRLFGLLVQPATRGAGVSYQPGGAQCQDPPPSAAASATASSRRLHGNRPRPPQGHHTSQQTAGAGASQRGGSQQIAGGGERGARPRRTGAALDGRLDVSETVKRMFPPKYIGHGPRWSRVTQQPGASEPPPAERDLSGAAASSRPQVGAALASASAAGGGQAPRPPGGHCTGTAQLTEFGTRLLKNESVF